MIFQLVALLDNVTAILSKKKKKLQKAPSNPMFTLCCNPDAFSLCPWNGSSRTPWLLQISCWLATVGSLSWGWNRLSGERERYWLIVCTLSVHCTWGIYIIYIFQKVSAFLIHSFGPFLAFHRLYFTLLINIIQVKRLDNTILRK